MFNLNQYQEIFDKILTDKNVSKGIVANTYLHILNTHPEFLSKYNLSTVKRFRQKIIIKVGALYKITHSLFSEKYYYQHQDLNTKVLLVSHLTNSQQLNQNDDAYFGDMSKQLSECGINSSIALINHTAINERKVLSSLKKHPSRRFVLSRSLDLSQEIQLYFLTRKTTKKLKELLDQYTIKKNIKKEVLMHCTSSALRIAWQVADITKKTGAECVVTTYEGHAWERLVYCYLREINPKIKCFAYQHAAVFKFQHALQRMIGKKYNPDIIFTAGGVSQDILKGSKRLKGIAISCLGSPKYLTPQPVHSKLLQHCLVIPEAFISENLLLFELSLAYAQQNHNQVFIWRLHPLLSFEILKGHSKIFSNLPDNIVLSENTLEEDISCCDSVLYRGSTAVVNAINSGLKPIYYQSSLDELSIDPIYQHQQGKFVAHNQTELKMAFEQDIDAETKQKLQDFAQDFYTPLDANKLIDLL